MRNKVMWNLWNIILFTCLWEHVLARTDEELKADLIKMILKCNEKKPIEISEIMALQQLKTPTNKDTKCLLACAYKMEGAINSKGMYDLEHAYALAEKEMDGDEKRLQNAKKLADICNKINNVKVSDGDKGCDRAALLFKCVVENAPKLGFKV